MLNISNIELNYISPYIRYVNNYAPARSYTKPNRIIYDFELMFVAEGSVDMWFDGVHHKLNKNDIFYLTPGINNHISVDEKSGFRTHCIHFDWCVPKEKYDFSAQEAYISPLTDAKRIEELCNRPIFEPIGFIPEHHIKNASPKIRELFIQCYYLYSQNSCLSKLKLKSSFIELITQMISVYNENMDNSLIVHPKVRVALEYIQTHFREDITVTQLSEMSGLSQKYFGTIFKTSIGKCFSAYLLETRIAAARELLAGTDLSIEEIAFSTGFSSIYYFSRCFKNSENITPSEFRFHAKSGGIIQRINKDEN